MLRLHLFKVVQRHQPFYESTFLLLLDEQQQHVWIPFVSDLRTQTFRMPLPTSQETSDVEPDTSEVLVQMIHALEGRVEEIGIEELYDDLLYARVTLRGKPGRHTVKARLDDALRLAIRERPAIFIAETVFDHQAITLADYGQTQEQQLATIEQLITDAPYLLQSRARPDNLDFSQGTRGWTFYHARGALDMHITRDGKPTLALTLQREEVWSRRSIILSYQSFRPGEYAGKRVRATAYLRAEGVPQPIFTMRLTVSFPLPPGISEESDQYISYAASSETMQIVDSQAWTPHSLVMDIPQGTYHIAFSLSQRGQGNGVIWLDRIELETVDDSVAVTDTSITSQLLHPFNLDFSHGLWFWQVKGEAAWHYERGIDTTTTTAGSPSAFLKSIRAEPASPCTLQQLVALQLRERTSPASFQAAPTGGTVPASPLTNDFLANVLHALGGALEEIAIDTLFGERLGARLHLRDQRGWHMVNASLKDGLLLAQREQSRISVSEAILAQRAVRLADYGATEAEQLAEILRHAEQEPNSLRPPIQEALNLDFSDGLRGWHCIRDASYGSYKLDPHTTLTGRASLAITLHQPFTHGSSGVLHYGGPLAEHYRGQRVRLSAYVKTEQMQQPDLTFHLSWPTNKIDPLTGTKARASCLTHSQIVPYAAESSWARHEMVINVPQQARSFSFDLGTKEQGKLRITGAKKDVIASFVAHFSNGYPK